MARQNMNSSTSTHPAMNGPAVAIRIGFNTKKVMIVVLYQSGACPRKFCVKELTESPVISSPYYRIPTAKKEPP
jgi:hypothetical protein